MIQLSLSGFVDTKVLSYKQLLADGKVSEKQAVVFELLRNFPEGKTFKEISKILHWPINQVTPRVNELCYDLDLVESVATQFDLVTQRHNKLWRVKRVKGWL